MRRNKHEASAFAELGIKGPFLEALQRLGFDTPTDIQTAMIPPVLEGRDVVGQARTGTGKTLAFALPTLQRLTPGVPFQVLCLVPTRELAVQVVEEVRRLAHFTKIKSEGVYGGSKIRAQSSRLKEGPEFVVGTPGRTMDFMGRGDLTLTKLTTVILDEVDRMLDIGFRDDIRKILRSIHTRHQTIFTSATIDEPIRRLIQQFTSLPLEINVSQDELTVDKVDQCYVTVPRHDKLRLLKMLLEREGVERTIIFTNTKREASRVTARLTKSGISAAEIHSDLVQRKREQVMEGFRGGSIRLLVATDLAARGIDVEGVSHVINYDIPDYAETYVHRIGRTARMGRAGKAVTLVTPEEGKQLTEIEKFINKMIPDHNVEGFVPSAPRDGATGARGASAPAPERAGVRTDPVGANAATPEAPEPAASPQTLGARFTPMRRRRRL
ncbi:MAG: RNA helicase CrhR [Phycisphaerae bacterium]|nr:RNA helicase CrhR [Phycisphaerae bacterium]